MIGIQPDVYLWSLDRIQGSCGFIFCERVMIKALMDLHMVKTSRYASKEQEQRSGRSSEELAARTICTLAINSSKYMTL